MASGKPTLLQILGRGAIFSAIALLGIHGLILTGPAVMTAMAAGGLPALLGAKFASLIIPALSASATIYGGSKLITNTIGGIFGWGIDKIKSFRERVSAFKQRVKARIEGKQQSNQNSNSNQQTNTNSNQTSTQQANATGPNLNQAQTVNKQSTLAGNIKSYVQDKLDSLRDPESFVAMNGSDRKRRAASLRNATSKLHKTEIKTQEKAKALQGKLDEQIQKKQEKLNQQAAKMRGQISKSRVSKKLQKERAKLAQVTTARKEQEQQDVRQAVAEAKQRLSVIKDKRNQRIKSLEEAKKLTAAKAKVANQNNPVIQELMKRGQFITRPKPTR